MEVWSEKYRPSCLEEIVCNGESIQILAELVKQGQLSMNLLLHGCAGTGKNSTLLAIAKCMYPNAHEYKAMVRELNCGSDTSVDIIRKEVKTFIESKSLFTSGEKKPKTIILDEADGLSSIAQAALRRMFEEYHNNVRFFLTTNCLHKIIIPIQSRCTKIWFGPLEEVEIVKRLSQIASLEHLVDVEEKALNYIAEHSNGDMRYAINQMQGIVRAHSQLKLANAQLWNTNLLESEVEQVLESKTIQDALSRLNKLRTRVSLVDIVHSIHRYVMKVAYNQDIRHLISNLSDLEYRLTLGTYESIQVCSLSSILCQQNLCRKQ